MSTEKNLLTSKRFFGAGTIDSFVNIELTSEKSILKTYKTDNVVDLNLKFSQERNACSKFCIYGIIQSKWCDSDSIKIDFYISDSTKNVNPSTEKNTFWAYDKTTGVSATTWSVVSRHLDDSNGSLSLNLYRKKKGSYFFPFELDMNSLVKNADGINTNKSIFISIEEPSKNAYLIKEIPFVFFDDEGVALEYGQETADILDNGDIIEINNNYPYFYDRHWLRDELIPDGPPYVSFVSRDSIEITEGGLNDRNIVDKLYPIEVKLSEPSKTGMERVNVEVVYGLDPDKQPYTTIIYQADAILQQNYIKWNYVGEDPLKYIYLRINDDYIVEPEERLTLKITPVYGCIADPEGSQMLSIYFKDNDVPSYVSFENSTIDFVEPRESGLFVPVKIGMRLDKTVLIDDQGFDLYIDRTDTDNPSYFGLQDPANGRIGDSIRINVNKTDTYYSALLYYDPNPLYDLKRQISFRMSGFTINLRPSSVVPNNAENKLLLYTTKALDDNYTNINIPYNTVTGKAVIRNVYNAPQVMYDENPLSGQTAGTELTTKMAYYSATPNGTITPNSQIYITGATSQSSVSNKNVKTMVVEQEFSLEITNLGSSPVILDYSLYKPTETCIIDFHSGYTFTTTANILRFDGEKFILRLPANSIFRTSGPTPTFPIPPGGFTSYINAYNDAWKNGTFTYTANTYGWTVGKYSIKIRNNSFNYVGNPPDTLSDADRNNFYRMNKLKKRITQRVKNGNTFNFNEVFTLNSGNDSNPKNYNVLTKLNSVYTRPEGDLANMTGTTLSIVGSDYFYDGVAIIPESNAFNTSTTNPSTKSKIFISEESVIDINKITLLSSTTNYSAVLPTSPVILVPPLSAHTLFCPFYFGELLVQNGWGQNTEGHTNFWGQYVVDGTYDSFVASYNVAGTFNYVNRTLTKWQNAYIDTFNNAVIEIINTGEIESYFPNGIVAKPGERVVLSQLPITPTNGTAGFYNIVRNLAPLALNLSTNYGFDQVSGMFKKCSYKISFLNFRIWNAPNYVFSNSWTFSNKVFNYSINLQQDVSITLPNNQLTTSPRYLISKYNRDVYVGTVQGGNSINCGNPWSWNQMKRLTRINSDAKMYIHGLIVTASSSSPVEESNFFPLSGSPANLGYRYHWCGNNPWGPDFWVYY